MARSDDELYLKPSMLDRLIDPGSEGSGGRRGYTVDQTIDAVQRDLEDLLNTRLTVLDVPKEFERVRESIVLYGLPDINSLNALTPQQRDNIGKMLEKVINRYEPRLRSVRVSLQDAGDGKERKMRYRVDARLNLDPSPDVVFETIVELATGHYSVQAASR
jgi:type VI secretion system protein ImpF